MKKSILVLVVIAALFSCAKKEVKPQPTIEEINAQYKNKFGYVTFWSKTEGLATAITNIGTIAPETLQAGVSGNPPTCDVFSKYTLYSGVVNTYSVYTTKITSDFRVVSDSLIATGEVVVGHNECKLVEIK